MPYHAVMPQFTQRVLVPELMDDPSADRDELDCALGFIRFVNMRLGGASAAIGHLNHWLRERPPSSNAPVRILDIGTGSADIPIAIARWATRQNMSVHITGVDLHETTIDLAREQLAAQNADLPIRLVQADALTLADRFEPESFDYVHAGMFLHHLPDIEVITVLRIMHRLSSHGMIWNDLIRGMLSRIGVKCLVRLMPGLPAMARHDAIASIDAGFTKKEALDMAQRVDLPRIRFDSHLFYRFTLTSDKVQPQPVSIARFGK